MAESRRDIEFRALDGTVLRGWFYHAAAEQPGNKSPCIIMAHGLSGLREQFLPSFASRFSASGFGVLVYDNRNWGSSDGSPRNESDPWKQVRDYSDAFDFAASLPEVDADRIVFWGTSFSGGNVIVAAALDKRIKAAIAQVPFVSGEASAHALESLMPAIHADRQAIKSGQSGTILQAIAASPEDERKGKQGIMKGPGVAEFLEALQARDLSWETKLTMQTLMNTTSFESQAYIHRVAPTPLLMVIGDSDVVTPTFLQLKAYSLAYEPKKIRVLSNCTHFDLYYGAKFEENISTQLEFLQEILGSKETPVKL